METPTEFDKQSYQNINVQEVLSYEVKKLREQYSGQRYSKSIHVLTAVDYNVDGQSEQRLRQAKTNYTGERIILIPYNLGDFHWIGVIIKFKVDEQIELAEFINPVKESNFIPDKLQREFRNVFPSTVLRSRVSQIHGDRQYSAFLT
ncbi:unnamed protein product, partial [Rotaria sp. Silwood2]